jgi:hypothetical protein
MSDEIVLKYTPANEGDHLYAVPQRNLTAADMENISPDQLRNMTLPGPSGKPMYTPVEKQSKAASKPKDEHAAKAEPVDDAPESPKKGDEA